MSIWITGDTHGDFKRFSVETFPEQKGMTREDFVIILGDFGGIWDYRGENKNEKWWLDWLEGKPYTTLFIDGNHENYNRLYEYPVIKFAGGKVHQIRPHVLHLMRGEVFDLQGKKFFAFGGASSHDIKDGILDPTKEEDLERIAQWRYDWSKMYRVLNQSWWPQELPSAEEMENGWDNLEKCHFQIDYILTHSPSTMVLHSMDGGSGIYKSDKLTDYLEQIRTLTDFKQHLFGHMHCDQHYYWDRATCFYEQIVRIV